jgi:hypothetical protein
MNEAALPKANEAANTAKSKVGHRPIAIDESTSVRRTVSSNHVKKNTWYIY